MELLSIFVLGVFLGSFLNVVIYRIPRDESIITGRSHCTKCSVTIKWYDLIPVLSYIFLFGKCRNCGNRISIRYLLIEVLTGAFFIVSYYFLINYGIIYWAFSLVILEGFFVLAIIDYENMILPDEVHIFIFIAILLYLVGDILGADLQSGVLLASYLSRILGVTILGGLFYGLWFFSDGKWMGFGDVKLMALIGFGFGFLGSLFVLYFSVILGSIIGIILMMTGKAGMKSKLPFGTFLGVGSIIYILFGASLMPYLILFLRGF